MDELLKKTKELSRNVNRTNRKGTKEYLIIADFGSSSVQSESGFIKQYFRVFTPVKSYKGRKLNSVYGDSFNPFKDTLMDYPTIVQYKLGKVGTLDWGNYNRLISLHISRCPLNCWHCYIDECLKSDCDFCPVQTCCGQNRKIGMGIKEYWFSAKRIVDSFIEQHNLDKKANILRITGGEPFLAPELLLEILEEFRKRQLQKEVFLWTETNLIPLVARESEQSIVSDELLSKLSEYRNFCVHPCFHGLSSSNFEEVTGQKINDFNLLLNAFKRLLDAGIDIYPTFGSNMSSPEDVECFYNKISEIDKFLPLRFCLIEYDLDYAPVKWRRKNIPDFAKKHEKINDRFQAIEKWNELLWKNTGYKYGDIPRHLVPIKKEVIMHSVNSVTKKMVHLFHSPYHIDYQKSLLQVIGLPIGAKGEQLIHYDKKWLNSTFIDEVEKINELGAFDAIFWVLGMAEEKEDDKILTKFDFACPLRLLRIIKVEKKNESYYIDFVAKEFMREFRKINDKDKSAFKKYMKIEFDGVEIPYPGGEKGYAYTGPEIKTETTRTLSLKKLYEILANIQGSSKEGIRIGDYPLVKIEGIEKSTISEDGLYKLSLGKEYKMFFSYYQGDLHRTRKIYVNGGTFNGKSDTGKISIEEERKSKEKTINIETKFDNLSFIIPLSAIVRMPWYKWKITSLGFFVFIMTIVFLFVSRLYLASSAGTKVSLGLLIIGIFLTRIWEVLTKKD